MSGFLLQNLLVLIIIILVKVGCQPIGCLDLDILITALLVGA